MTSWFWNFRHQQDRKLPSILFKLCLMGLPVSQLYLQTEFQQDYNVLGTLKVTLCRRRVAQFSDPRVKYLNQFLEFCYYWNILPWTNHILLSSQKGHLWNMVDVCPPPWQGHTETGGSALDFSEASRMPKPICRTADTRMKNLSNTKLKNNLSNQSLSKNHPKKLILEVWNHNLKWTCKNYPIWRWPL